jgi:hypothetical protein
MRDTSGVHLHPLSRQSRLRQNQDETVKLIMAGVNGARSLVRQ